MKIVIESTTKLVELNGVPARVWEGRTDTGIHVMAFITRLATHESADRLQFEQELESCMAPTPEAAAIPLRLIL